MDKFTIICKEHQLTQAKLSSIFGLKNPGSFSTTSAHERYKATVVNLYEAFTPEEQRPYWTCPKCAAGNLPEPPTIYGDHGAQECSECGTAQYTLPELRERYMEKLRQELLRCEELPSFYILKYDLGSYFDKGLTVRQAVEEIV